MNIFGFLKKRAIRMALENAMDKIINPRLAGIAKVRSLSWKDGRLQAVCALEGLDNVEIDIVCNSVSIAPDGGSVTLGDFTSNMPFAENALNQFAARSWEIPDTGMARGILAAIKKTLDI